MNQLTKIFNGHQLRIINNGDETEFVAKDVCDILEIKNSRMALSRLDGDEKGVSSIDTHGGYQKIGTVNEFGLYNLVLSSRKPEAKQFKRWVTHEVIPSIRKNGYYELEKPSYMIDDPIKRAERWIIERKEYELLEQQRKEELPYTNFGKAVSNSNASINIGSFSKMMYDDHGIKLGRNKMFKWLRDNGYLIKTGREKNQPKQQYIEQGLFTTTVTMISRTHGDVESVTTLITGKGQVKLSEKLIQEYGVTV
ncbi:phage antirepressor KilAC domain-containing protein [Gracilibacillus sp. YIM 98692]|uniref:phage antirepressor KilAC domain-containing protein n=1 Tax=Gracilibacillus sp. YIM 98692 TaxID=2663532 RepID=UPI0013D0E166|nr:phage antirepressor KilAC domain-containing protein [Gracilibacillus sp. YIM 98692]